MTKLLMVVVLAALVFSQALANPWRQYRRYYTRYPTYYRGSGSVVGYGGGAGSVAIHGGGSPYYYGGFGSTYVAQNPGAVHIVHGVHG